MTRAAALLLLAAIASCARLPLPSLGGSGDPSLAGLLENRVWLEQDALVPGTARTWMSSGQMLTTSCFELPRLTEWRWTDTAELEWTEGRKPVPAEVAAAGPDELVLLIGAGDAPRVLRLRAAEAGGLC